MDDQHPPDKPKSPIRWIGHFFLPLSPIQSILNFCVFFFSVYELYKAYSAREVFQLAKGSRSWFVSYDDSPISFDFAVGLYIFIFVLAGAFTASSICRKITRE
ncbi:MAG TPA: hypothetical protein VK591_13575 [Xanthobacteraceae bacterium]|nr:hypothetical protein [Xanthobacteraceae bacterium]